MMIFSRATFIKLWIAATCILVGLYFFAKNQDVGTTFFLLINALNIALIAIALLFRNQINKTVASLEKRYLSIQHNSEQYRITTKYAGERIVGTLLVTLVATLGLYVVYLASLDKHAYRILIEEDGIIEYGSSFFWAISAIALIFCVVKNKLSQAIHNFWPLPYLLLIAFFIICGGEEISWGQRIFDLDTPEILKSVNVQNEITLHNIGSISVFSNAFFLLTLSYFIAIPFLIARNDGIKNLIQHYALPTPNKYATKVYSIALLVWLFLGLRFGTLGFHPFSFYEEKYYTQMDDEMFEFLAAYTFFCFSAMDCLKQTRLNQS